MYEEDFLVFEFGEMMFDLCVVVLIVYEDDGFVCFGFGWYDVDVYDWDVGCFVCVLGGIF